MAEKISVCHVVNSVGKTNMPGDLATTQASFKELDQVGILAWFNLDSFRNMQTVETISLDVPNSLHINRSQYTMAKSVLSEYDVIHTHNPHAGFYGKLLAKRLGKPVVHTEHNNHDGFTRKGRIANGLTNVFADAVVCVSASVRESFFRWEDAIVEAEKINIINNGVDIERLETVKSLDWSIHDVVDIDPEAVIVGSAGMLVEQKAHDVLIEAVDLANQESEQPIELVISGDGELREQLEAQIDHAKFSDRLHLLGFLEEREQVYKMMHEVDIYAMPSRWEGFCVAALEAMAIGNACVFSDIPEFAKPFESNVLLHTPSDSDDLAHKLLSLYNNSDLRNRLTKKARQMVVQTYTIEQTAQEYIDIYVRSSAGD